MLLGHARDAAIRVAGMTQDWFNKGYIISEAMTVALKFPLQFDFNVEIAATDSTRIKFQKMLPVMNNIQAAMNRGYLTVLGYRHFTSNILNLIIPAAAAGSVLQFDFDRKIDADEAGIVKFQKILFVMNKIEAQYTTGITNFFTAAATPQAGASSARGKRQRSAELDDDAPDNDAPIGKRGRRNEAAGVIGGGGPAAAPAPAAPPMNSAAAAAASWGLPSGRTAPAGVLVPVEAKAAAMPTSLADLLRRLPNLSPDVNDDVVLYLVTLLDVIANKPDSVTQLQKLPPIHIDTKKEIVKAIFQNIEVQCDEANANSYLGTYLPILLDLPNWKEEFSQTDTEKVTVLAQLFPVIKNPVIKKPVDRTAVAITATFEQLKERGHFTSTTRFPTMKSNKFELMSLLKNLRITLFKSTPTADAKAASAHLLTQLGSLPAPSPRAAPLSVSPPPPPAPAAPVSSPPISPPVSPSLGQRQASGSPSLSG